MTRLAVGYTPVHLKFPVHSQNASLDLPGTRFVFRLILGCTHGVGPSYMYVPPVTWYSFFPRAFARVHRAFAVRPLVQLQVRFPSISLL